MTLDEAIEHAKQVANTCDNSECAANHMQLAEWLRRARGADKAARWYTNRIQKLEDENAKLLDERNHWRVEQVHAHSNWVDAYKRATELELENAKLRELIADVHESLCTDKAGMFHKLILASMEDDMRELGVGVDDGTE